jgi:diguanylate cyclase (GGDEF)-like protein/PAS domain S-box-containing protein
MRGDLQQKDIPGRKVDSRAEPSSAASPSSQRERIGFGNKLLTAKEELRRPIRREQFQPYWIGALIAGIVFTVAALSDHLIYDGSREALQSSIRNNLKRLARISAGLVDPEAHEALTTPDQESSEAYRRAIEPLGRFVAADGEIAFAYTCVKREGQIFFVLDPTPPGDTNGDGVDEKSHIMDPYPEAPKELHEAFDRRTTTADIRPYRDRWGVFVSGYAPIRDASGRVVAVAGVDLSAENYASQLAGVDSAYRESLLLAALLAILAGFVSGAAQVRSSAMRRESEARDRRYREQIAQTVERVESAMRIAELSRNRFSDLFEGIPVSCFTFDAKGRILEWNSQALATFDRRPHDLLEKDLAGVLGSLYGPEQRKNVEAVLRGESFIAQIWSDGGCHFLMNGHPLLGPDGQVTGGILAAVDITGQKLAEDRAQAQLEELNQAHEELNCINRKLQEANERLAMLATTDMLTGLPNRRAFYEALQVSLAKARRGKIFALVQADIDYFKLFNDVYGHHAGDEVLRLFGECLRKSVRPDDLVARHGGEEFFLLLAQASEEETLAVVERIRTALAELKTRYGNITASFGVAFWEEAIESDEQLMQLTDDALYTAKARGRNCVVVADSGKRLAA